MPDETPDAPRSSFTLDLSSASAGKPKRPKGFVPVVQKTINLTTKRRDEARAASETPAAASTEARQDQPRRAETRRDEPRSTGSHRSAGRRDEPRRDEARLAGRSGGTSLADLLDEATLARLRGGQ